MATGSAIPATIDYLIATLAAALPAVLVIDGMENTDSAAHEILFVGLSDPDGTGPEDAASSDQKWAILGHNKRDETLTVNLVALSWNGDGIQKTARDGVFAIADAISDLIQTDPTLGGTVLCVTDMSRLSLRQASDDSGISAYLPLGLTCRARLS